MPLRSSEWTRVKRRGLLGELGGVRLAADLGGGERAAAGDDEAAGHHRVAGLLERPGRPRRSAATRRSPGCRPRRPRRRRRPCRRGRARPGRRGRSRRWRSRRPSPSRRTVGLASPMTARLSRVFLARSSWMMPMPVLAMITKPKRLSWIGATNSMITQSTPMIGVEPGEDVGADDLGGGAGGADGYVVDLAAGDPLGDLGGRSARRWRGRRRGRYGVRLLTGGIELPAAS